MFREYSCYLGWPFWYVPYQTIYIIKVSKRLSRHSTCVDATAISKRFLLQDHENFMQRLSRYYQIVYRVTNLSISLACRGPLKPPQPHNFWLDPRAWTASWRWWLHYLTLVTDQKLRVISAIWNSFMIWVFRGHSNCRGIWDIWSSWWKVFGDLTETLLAEMVEFITISTY